MARGDFATTHIELGPCECPRSPHKDGDWADVKDRLQFGDVRRIAGVLSGIALDGTAMMIARSIVAWNLTDAEAKPIHIPVHDNGWTDLTTVDGLSIEQSQKLREVIDTERYAVQLLSESAKPDPLPNPSSGPSADGSAETSTPTPTTSPTSSPTTS